MSPAGHREASVGKHLRNVECNCWMGIHYRMLGKRVN